MIKFLLLGSCHIFPPELTLDERFVLFNGFACQIHSATLKTWLFSFYLFPTFPLQNIIDNKFLLFLSLNRSIQTFSDLHVTQISVEVSKIWSEYKLL